MDHFKDNIEVLTRKNTFFRHVIFTAPHSQLVLMSLKPNEEIGEEVHTDTDQFFRFESGEGKVVINGEEQIVRQNDAVVVPAGAKHNIINTSTTSELKMYTIYSPAHHPDGTIHKTKDDAMNSEK